MALLVPFLPPAMVGHSRCEPPRIYLRRTVSQLRTHDPSQIPSTVSEHFLRCLPTSRALLVRSQGPLTPTNHNSIIPQIATAMHTFKITVNGYDERNRMYLDPLNTKTRETT